MNEINKMDKKKKIILITSIITLIILGIISATVSYFGWFGEESSISITVSGEGSCSVKEDNGVFIEPTATREEGRVVKFTASQGLTNQAYISWTMTINSIGGLQDATFKYEMINGTTGASYGSGNFADITEGSTITFSNDTETLAYDEEYEFILYLWIDGTIGNNPLSMADQTFDFDMNCTITDGLEDGDSSSGTTLIDHITNLYVENYDSSKNVTFADDTGMNYYAPNARLMNDGLDSTGAMVDEASAINGTAGNIRYYGADDENLKNYIYFNCSDYSNQSSSTCETWRIIGIVDGKVKLIRGSSLGNYSWDYTSTSEYDNNWSDATLNTLLNTTYYNSGSTTYYNDSTTGETVSFASNGITKATRDNNLISQSTWYTNGMPDPDIYANASYKGERTGTSTYPSNIGLAYPSDYGYGTDLNTCTSTIYNYNYDYEIDTCLAVNWLTSIFSTSDGLNWLITPDSNSSSVAWHVNGGVNGGTGTVSVPYGVFPVLYLDSELVIESGTDGSSTSPYKLIVS